MDPNGLAAGQCRLILGLLGGHLRESLSGPPGCVPIERLPALASAAAAYVEAEAVYHQATATPDPGTAGDSDPA